MEDENLFGIHGDEMLEEGENHSNSDGDHEFDDLIMSWDRMRQLAVIKMICLVTYGLYLLRKRHQSTLNYNHMPTKEEAIERESARRSFCEYLRSTRRCQQLLRMKPETFARLCDILRSSGRLNDSHQASVEEQVAIFLYIVGHNQRNSSIQGSFRCSSETVSRYFHKAMEAIISLEDQFLIQPNGSTVSPEILNNPRFYPYFKDCVGAIDGTHIRVKVSETNAPRYRGRKPWPTQNVFAACTFDLKFTYVLPGWEGTASDSRIIKNALTREDKLDIPEGKYYLVNGGFMLRSNLITPYRGVRYHLKEYSKRAPENAKELFNLRHASLRNAIERAFGVLKKRFAIIASTNEPHYPFDAQRDIVSACCIIHNFLMGVDPDQDLIDEVDRELSQTHIRRQSQHGSEDEESKEGAIIRDNIAAQMWNDYMAGSSKKGDRGSQIKWTEKMDAFLIDALLHQQVIGNRVSGQWTSTSYDSMVTELSEKLDKPLKKEHLMNRQKTLKKNFNEAHDMFKNSSGFGWVAETKLFHAEDKVWEAKIEAKPEAEKFRTTPVPFYDKLAELYARDRANGEGTKTPKERARESNTITSIDDIDEMVSQNKISLENYGTNVVLSDEGSSPTESYHKKTQGNAKKSIKGETSSRVRKRKASADDDQEIAILKHGLDNVAEAIREGNSVLRQIRHRVYSTDEVFEEIMKIGVDETEQFKAYRFLNAKPKRVDEFFGCPSHLRKAFLLSMMDDEGSD